MGRKSNWSAGALRRTVCAAAACAAVLTACTRIAGAERLRVPVIVVALDSVPARLTGLGGADSCTPVLDRLAQSGLLYSRCVAPEPWSEVSLAAALSGADDQAATLPEVLGRAGWRTHALLAHDSVAQPAVLRGFEDVQHLGAGDAAGGLAADVVAAALACLDSTDPRAPFLLVHLADARPPHHLYPGLVEAADAPYTGPCAAGLPHAELLRVAGTFQPADFTRLRALAASEVAAVDQALGALLEGLARRGLADGAVVAVIGTRGAWLGEQGRVGFLPGLEPEVLHVPFVLALPERIHRAKSGLMLRGVIDAPTLTSDLAPTLLDVLELTAAAEPRAPVDHGENSENGEGGESRGRSVLPGAPALSATVRLATERGRKEAAVVGEDGLVQRDLEARTEAAHPFPPLPGVPAPRFAEGPLRLELDAWLGPLQPRAKR